jgi:hypothetical protein
MKILILLTLFLTSFAIADDYKEMNFATFAVKQKVLPIKIRYKEDSSKLYIEIKAEKEIQDFRVKSARGLDGLKVGFLEDTYRETFYKKDDIKFSLNYSAPSSQSYLVLDIEGTVNSRLKRQSIAIPIGKIPQSKAEKESPKRKIMELRED